MKKNKIIIIAVIVTILIGLLSIVYFNYGSKDEEINLTYVEFLEFVQQNKVKVVYLDDNTSLKGKVNGELVDGSNFVTDNPRTERFKETLLMNNIKVEENSKNSMVVNALGFVVFIVALGGMGLFFSKHASKQTSREFSKMSNMDTEDQVQSKVTFSNVAGNVEAKESILDLVDFLKSPDKYARYGARIPRGIILYGPPGNGKTLMAKALAGEANVPFYAVSGSDFVQIYAGLGAGRIRSLFKKAREKGNCVIFIDEIDALGKKRDGIGGNDETDRTLNALLTEMSGFNENEGIIVMAATNRLDTLDDALLRPGRFDRHIEVSLPDVNAREQILKLHSRRKPLSASVSLSKLANQTVYFSGAQLEGLLNEAAILAAKEDSEDINLGHVDKAYYTVIAGEEKKDRSGISKVDREITAYHEAGHALITKLIAPERKVTKVTIIPSTKGAGGFSMNIPPDRLYRSKLDMVHNIKIALAGRAAEEIIFGEDNITTGASNDIEKATETLISMVKQFGMNQKLGMLNYRILQGNNIDVETMAECRRLIELYYEETKRLINDNIDTLTKITDSLLEKETLNEEDIDNLISLKKCV